MRKQDCTNDPFAADDDAHHAAASLLGTHNPLPSPPPTPLIPTSPPPQVVSHVSDATAKGAKVLTGGGPPDLPDPLKGGYFYAPTVLRDATIDM